MEPETVNGRAGPEASVFAAGDIQAKAWAYSCATCHGVDRSAVQGIPTLAGMPADDIVKAMLAYASGERPGALKGQIARGYDEAVLRRIGQWYESLPRGKAGQP
ncbi:c-type cytochrome [Pollutimonas sp. H1-120]